MTTTEQHHPTMDELTVTAATILRTFSNGSLPRPSYLTLGGTEYNGSIGFQMDSGLKVQRWAQALDSEVKYDDYPGHVEYQVNFEFNGASVHVYHIDYKKDHNG